MVHNLSYQLHLLRISASNSTSPSLRRSFRHFQSPLTTIFAICTAFDTLMTSILLSQSLYLLLFHDWIIAMHHTIHFLPAKSNVSNNNQNALDSAISSTLPSMHITLPHSNRFVVRTTQLFALHTFSVNPHYISLTLIKLIKRFYLVISVSFRFSSPSFNSFLCSSFTRLRNRQPSFIYFRSHHHLLARSLYSILLSQTHTFQIP